MKDTALLLLRSPQALRVLALVQLLQVLETLRPRAAGPFRSGFHFPRRLLAQVYRAPLWFHHQAALELLLLGCGAAPLHGAVGLLPLQLYFPRRLLAQVDRAPL